MTLGATCVLRSVMGLVRHSVHATLYEKIIGTVIYHYRWNFLSDTFKVFQIVEV